MLRILKVLASKRNPLYCLSGPCRINHAICGADMIPKRLQNKDRKASDNSLLSLTHCHWFLRYVTNLSHQETATLPVHNSLVSDHASNQIVTSILGKHNIKQTLRSKCLPSVAHFLINGTLPAKDNAAALKACHVEVVHSSVNNLNVNRVLGVAPPSICRPEGLLTPPYRTTLLSCAQGSARAWQIIGIVWAS